MPTIPPAPSAIARRMRHLLLAAFLGGGLLAWAQKPHHDAAGDVIARFESVLDGNTHPSAEHVITLRAGERVSLVLVSDAPGASYFDLLPAVGGEPLYVGEVEGRSSWQGRIATTGEYRIRMYLDPIAARAGKRSAVRLSLSRQR